MTKKKTSIFLIVIILMISGLAMYFRCHYYEPISDDLLYQYILDDNPLGSNNLSQPVRNLQDAIYSQSTQYFYSNGRAIVHTFVQMFVGPWGRDAFCIFISIYFICVLILFARYSFIKNLTYNVLVWTMLSIAYLYLFPGFSKTWYSTVGGMNYLYPMLPILVLLLLLRHYQNKVRKLNLIKKFLLILAGLIAGWSQECFSLPVSGALFIWILLNFRNINIPVWLLTVSLWTGTAILVLAPGNFIRLGGGPGIFYSVLNGFKLLNGTLLFWILLGCLIWLYFYNKHIFVKFVKTNSLLFFTLAASLLLGFIANTLPQSFYGISFFSAIVLFRLFSYIPCFNKLPYKLNIFLTILLLIGMTIHQGLIIRESRRIQIINQRFIDNYISSPLGIVKPEVITSPSYIKPYIQNWFSSTTLDWLMFTIQQHYGHGQKPLFLLSSNESLDEKSIKGIPGVYQAQQTIWFDPSVKVSVGDTVYITFTDSVVAPKPSFKSEIKHKIKDILYNTLQNKKKPEYGNKSTIIVNETNIKGNLNGMKGIRVGGRKVKNLKISHKQLDEELKYEESLDTCSNVQ